MVYMQEQSNVVPEAIGSVPTIRYKDRLFVGSQVIEKELFPILDALSKEISNNTDNTTSDTLLSKIAEPEISYVFKVPDNLRRQDMGQLAIIGQEKSITNIEKEPEKSYEKPENIGENDKGIFISFLNIASLGFLDSINPCAIGLLVLLLSLLQDRKEKDKKYIILSYITGILLTNILITFGVIKVMDYITKIPIMRIGVYVIVIWVLLFALYNSLKGIKENKIISKIPNKTRGKLQELLEKVINSKSSILIIFVTAVFIALVEFSCTGQMFLPAMMIINNELVDYKIFSILIYNFMLILSLIITVLIDRKGKSLLLKVVGNAKKLNYLSTLIICIALIYFSIQLFKILN